jgi:alcohol dehydrogenase YqhD (iron-dependent ADH family)
LEDIIMQFNLANPTRIIFGENSIEQIGGAIAESGVKKVLLVAGGGSIKKNGVYDSVVSSLKSAGIEWVECWGVQPNPVLSKVREAIEMAKADNVEAILAVGGGSVVDTSKAVAAGVYLDDIWQAFEWKVAITKALPVYTVLTLSATGSEMNGNAVVTNMEEKKKWGIGSKFLYPKVSIIDPTVQDSLPWEQTLNGGLDAIAHILEYYFHGTTQETTIAVEEALLRTIIGSVDKLQANQKDNDSRGNLAWAATLALNGVAGAGMQGGDWACHDIEHSISALFPDVAHGAGLGIVFPAWMIYAQDANPEQFKRFARNIWDCDSIEVAVARMRAKIIAWGGAARLRDLGIPEDKLKDIAANATMTRSLGRLKVLEQADVENILRLAY